MKQKCLHLLACLFLSVAFAQEADDENPNTFADQANSKKHWEANVAGGNYAVHLNRISSISKHRYLLDSHAVVTEVVIDTLGCALARFYYMEPLGPAGEAADAAKRLLATGGDILDASGRSPEDMAAKNYPSTTHAHTIEYRLLSLQQLNALYDSLHTAWDTDQGRTFTAK